MQMKDIRDPVLPNSGIAFLNFGKNARQHPDIVGKIRLDDGTILELALFAKGNNGMVFEVNKARFFGVSVRKAEQITLPTIEEEDDDYGTRLDNLG